MTLHEDQLDLQIPKSVSISADGKEVVYPTTLALGHKTGEHSISTLWHAEVGSPDSAHPLIKGDDFSDHSPAWAPSGDKIAFLSDRGGRGKTNAIYLVSPTGSDPSALTPETNEQQIQSFLYSPDGSKISYLTSDEKTEARKAKEAAKDDARVYGEDWGFQRLRIVDVRTKEVTTLAAPDLHIIEHAWNDSGSKIAYATVDTPDPESCDVSGTRFWVIDVESKAVEEICHFPTFIGSVVWAGDAIYFIGQGTDTSLVCGMMVYRIQITDTGPYSYKKYAYGVDSCGRSLIKRNGHAIAEVQNGMKNEFHLLNGKKIYSFTKTHSAWDVVIPDKADPVVAVAYSSTGKPSEMYSVQGQGDDRKVEQLSKHAESFEGRTGGTYRSISCPSADGRFTLSAAWQTPQDKAGPFPTVVYLHGGPYDRMNDAFDITHFTWGPLVLDAGYAILSPNYRGGSGYGNLFASHNSGREDIESIKTIVTHAVKSGLVDPERLVVAGWSNGGTLSYLSMVRNDGADGWKYKAVIAGAGMSEIDAASMSSDMGIWKAALGGQEAWRCARDDTTNRRGSALWDFAQAAEKGYIPPTLILHPERDERVPVEQAHGMKRALRSAGLPFEFVVYPNAPHMLNERGHLLDLGRRVVGFVKKHIGDAR